MASRIFGNFTSTQKLKKARTMIKDVLIIIYLVMPSEEEVEES